MQYLKLLDLPGLKLMSRFQLAWAILMFVGVPAMTLMIALVPLKFFDGEDLSTFPSGLAIGGLRHVPHHVPVAEARRPRRHSPER